MTAHRNMLFTVVTVVTFACTFMSLHDVTLSGVLFRHMGSALRCSYSKITMWKTAMWTSHFFEVVIVAFM